MATINVLDSAGSVVALEKPLVPGRAAAATSRPVVLSTEDLAKLDSLLTVLGSLATQTTLASILAKIIAAPSTESKQDTIISSLTTLAGYLDSVETLITTTNGYVDGLEGLIGTSNTSLASIAGYVDGIETLIGTTNTSLTTLAGYLDSVETLIGSTNTKLDSVIAKQPSLGTAGAASSNVITVQGILGGTSQPVTARDPYSEYESVAASQTNQSLGTTGAVGDYLAGVLIIPATDAAGAVSIKDGANTAITIFVGGGTTALPSLVPFFVPLGIVSTNGTWQITTGTNVSVIGVGDFT